MQWCLAGAHHLQQHVIKPAVKKHPAGFFCLLSCSTAGRRVKNCKLFWTCFYVGERSFLVRIKCIATWQQRTKAFSSITIWFCTNFLLQMVSEELLIRRNCCSFHLLLCYVFHALHLSYSPRELPEMQRNYSPTLITWMEPLHAVVVLCGWVCSNLCD